jgi:phage protein D
MPTNNSSTLYLSRPILKLNGANAPEELMKDVLEIIVDESLHMPSMFILKIHNVYLAASEQSKEWKNEKYFNIGDSLSIGFVSSTTEDPEFQKSEEDQKLIDGEITGIEVKFSNTSEAHIVVTGYDVSHRLHRGRFNRSFLNSTDSDIVKRIATEMRVKIGQVDRSGTPHEYVFQENQTNMEFLRERAARIGFELFVQNDKLYFRKPKSERSLMLEWLTDINSFNVRVTSAEQVSAVEVNSWDYSQKKLITETAKKEQLITDTGNGQGGSISQAFKLKQPPKMIVVDQPVNNNAKEAKQMAQSLYDELSGEFVTADAKAEGNPQIRPGRVIALANMGTRYSGKYYVTETRHRYCQRVYKTNFAVRGLREGTLLSTLPPKTHLQPGQTLLVGLVTNNNDPKGWGRVKVKYPTLSNKDESQWARVVGLGASMNRGFYCLPEINDEVLIGFEHGDIHRPYVIGGVWNGKDKTVETVADTIKNNKVRLRTIKTRTGHTVQFVEEDLRTSKAGIYIKTKNGHHIELNDSQKYIQITTARKHRIRMDDNLTSKGIFIKTAGRHRVDLNDKTSTITVQTKMGQSLTFRDPGMKVTLQTTGFVNVKAASGVNVRTGGFVNVKAGGFVNVTAIGALSAKAAGPISLISGANITLGAPTISLSGVVNSPPPIPNPAGIAAAVAAAGATAIAAESISAPTMI